MQKSARADPDIKCYITPPPIDKNLLLGSMSHLLKLDLRWIRTCSALSPKTELISEICCNHKNDPAATQQIQLAVSLVTHFNKNVSKNLMNITSPCNRSGVMIDDGANPMAEVALALAMAFSTNGSDALCRGSSS